jgi:MprA protease rhombosortase-interaction domain-containing protein
MTPFGGSAGSIATGDFFADGRYNLVWDYTEPNQTAGAAVGFLFTEATGGGGAVPLPGAAGLAAIGLVGLARRRRR